MYCSSLLIFLELFTLSHGYMLWNPHQIEYERFQEAVDEAIAQEAKKKYDSPLDLPRQDQQAQSSQDADSNLRSWFPIWTPWSSPPIQIPSNLPTTTIIPILPTTKSQNVILRSPWSSKISFPIKQRSTKKAKINKNAKTRKLTKYGPKKKSKNKQFNPLCFFSALPCGPRRKNVYYVPMTNKN